MANSKGGPKGRLFSCAPARYPQATDNIRVNGSNDDGFVRKSRVRSSDFGILLCFGGNEAAEAKLQEWNFERPAALWNRPVVRI
jgi:hypothetical protein